MVWLALRYLGMDEWIVSVMRAMYEDALTKVRVSGRERKTFNVRAEVAQSSVLSLRFSACLSSCWRLCLENSGKVYLWNLQFVNDPVLIAETKELLLEKL